MGRDSTPDTRVVHGVTLTLPLRVWDKITITEDCWIWTGANTGEVDPYGVTWDGERRVKAHRFTYEALHGPIAPGLVADHLCRTRLCVKPPHIEPVTNAENILRGNAPGPTAVRTNACKRGHAFTPENTKLRPDGRECRTCAAVSTRASKARRKELVAS